MLELLADAQASADQGADVVLITRYQNGVVTYKPVEPRLEVVDAVLKALEA
jgi:hypothetical protein